MANVTSSGLDEAHDGASATHSDETNDTQPKQVAIVAQPKSKSGAGGAGDAGGDVDDFDAWMKSRQLAKPDDQLDLTEAELGEEVTRVLTVTNTNVIHNLVAFSFKDGEFVVLPPAGNTITLLDLEGHALHIDSEEARHQIEDLGEVGYPIPPPRHPTDDFVPSRRRDEDEGEEEGEPGEGGEKADEGEPDVEGEGEAEGDVEEEVDEEAKPEDMGEEEQEGVTEGDTEAAVSQMGGKKRKLINQFNFCERAALTYTNPKRNVETQTIPPPRSQYGSNVLQWNIYDGYAEDYEKQQREKDKKDDKKGGGTLRRRDKKKLDKTAEAEALNRKYLKCWQILERMINQNIFDEIGNDYRYWEDPADEFRDGEGTLLPLWKFQYEPTKKMNITEILFSPFYYDLFAVCFGSFEFLKQPNEGALCLFTIKNPSFPDYVIMTESGCMCCDIHPTYPYLVAIGLYDGNVHVYNLNTYKYNEPLYASFSDNKKHLESIAEIKWGPNLPDGEINFYTISSDGRVFHWILMQNELNVTTIITLYLENNIVDGPDGTSVRLKSCGSCMGFHPTDPEIFLVGTEEGYIYKCSTAYSSKYLMTYHAHNLSVYRIDYNRFNPNIFASCSGDWRVKVWEDMRPEPLFIFDLGSAVGDVKWAPYSSTVFAAATSDGKVYVYDLNVNKYQPICVQAVVPKRKNGLNRLCFNEKLPFIIVGDEKGTTTSLKLSPNLRLMVKPPKKQQYLDQTFLQKQKLEKLLSLVRELPEGAVANEPETTVQS